MTRPVVDRSGEPDEVFRARVARFEAAPAAPESWPAAPDEANARRLAWFSDAELEAEVARRRGAPADDPAAASHVHAAVATRHGHPGVCCCLTQSCAATDCSRNAALIAALDGRPEHDHVTRDIKPRGQCPACDSWYEATR